ncbi:MAG: tRNA adenosine(34) deaminase TadA [candidate division KSB1 bacterium]|nr:tRNA adenosine(34) deaminase TadA [candidate division KSB1 bacterium]
MKTEHSKWMQLALLEAQKASQKKEVPVGCVIVQAGQIVGRGHNLVETLQDATAHAEMQAIKSAAQKLNSWRLENTVLYATLEPCSMCVGAILLSRISGIVYGASDPRYGACGSVLQIANHKALDVSVDVESGVLESRCREVLQRFFRELRKFSERCESG